MVLRFSSPVDDQKMDHNNSEEYSIYYSSTMIYYSLTGRHTKMEAEMKNYDCDDNKQT